MDNQKLESMLTNQTPMQKSAFSQLPREELSYANALQRKGVMSINPLKVDGQDYVEIRIAEGYSSDDVINGLNGVGEFARFYKGSAPAGLDRIVSQPYSPRIDDPIEESRIVKILTKLNDLSLYRTVADSISQVKRTRALAKTDIAGLGAVKDLADAIENNPELFDLINEEYKYNSGTDLTTLSPKDRIETTTDIVSDYLLIPISTDMKAKAKLYLMMRVAEQTASVNETNETVKAAGGEKGIGEYDNNIEHYKNLNRANKKFNAAKEESEFIRITNSVEEPAVKVSAYIVGIAVALAKSTSMSINHVLKDYFGECFKEYPVQSWGAIALGLGGDIALKVSNSPIATLGHKPNFGWDVLGAVTYMTAGSLLATMVYSTLKGKEEKRVEKREERMTERMEEKKRNAAPKESSKKMNRLESRV